MPNQDEQIVDIVKQKQKRKRPDLTEMFSPKTEPGEMAAMITKTVAISHWDPIDTDDPAQVAQRIDQYHQFCIQHDMRPYVVGLAMAIGVDRVTLWKWENGVENHKPQQVRNLIKKAREINEIIMDQMMQTGKINPVTGIFLLKNNFGYKDQQDVVITPNTPADQGAADDVKNKFLKALPEASE